MRIWSSHERMGSCDFHGNMCLSSWHFPDGSIISWDRIVRVGGPLAKLLIGWFAYIWMQKHQKLTTFGICFNVVSAPLQVPMLPVLLHCLAALAPVAWNLRDLHQKDEMSCEIRVFWPDFAQDRGDYLMIFRFAGWNIYIYIYIYLFQYIYI